jgi:hypothetical protein
MRSAPENVAYAIQWRLERGGKLAFDVVLFPNCASFRGRLRRKNELHRVGRIRHRQEVKYTKLKRS